MRRGAALAVFALAVSLISPAVVLANSAPSITPDSATLTGVEGGNLYMLGSMSDPEGDALTLGASIGTIDNASRPPGPRWRWRPDSNDGPFESDVTVTADDGNGHIASAMFHVSITNEAPLVGIDGPTLVPSNSVSGREFTAYIADHGEDTFTYEFHCGSQTAIPGGPTNINGDHKFTCRFTAAGQYQVGVTAQDSDGATSQAYMTVTAVPNDLSADDGYLKLLGDIPYHRFGGSLAKSDMNGDGIDDLAIGNGAPAYDQNDFTPRSVFVMLGGSHSGSITSGDLVPSTGFKITGAEGDNRLGISLATAGDFNGDGFGDLAIGNQKVYSDFNGAYIVFGSAHPTNVDLTNLGPGQGLVISASDPGFAFDVAGGGDINGDGLDDVVVLGAKCICVIFGGITGPVDLSADPSTFGVRLTGFGTNSAALGDVNGDGLADMVFGSDDIGKMRVVYGSRALTGTFNVDTMAAGAGVTWTVYVNRSRVVVGDINGDGFADILELAHGWNTQANDDRDQVLLFKGATSLPTSPTPWAQIIGPDGANGGFDTMATGDWNGDGLDDIALGGGVEELDANGSVWVVPGATNMGTTYVDPLGTLTRIDGDKSYDLIGEALVIGNFDGDNKSDLAIGAPDDVSGDEDVGPWGRVSLVENPAPDMAAPLVFKPGATVVDGNQLTASPKIRLFWPAARDSGGIAKYILQLKRNTGSWTNVALPGPLVRHVDLALISKKSVYRVRLRAVDLAGHKSTWNLGASFVIQTLQENSSYVAYSGPWTRTAQTGASGGYVTMSSTPGAKATLHIYAFSVGFVATTGPGMGMARISVDGFRRADIDLYSPTQGSLWIAFALPLMATSHSYVVEVLPTANAASTGHEVRLDAFVFLN